MPPPDLTVIECDNPDDNFSQVSTGSHLQLVPPPEPPTVVTVPRPLLLTILEGVIATLVNWQYSLEMLRADQERRRAAQNGSNEPMVGNRGW